MVQRDFVLTRPLLDLWEVIRLITRGRGGAIVAIGAIIVAGGIASGIYVPNRFGGGGTTGGTTTEPPPPSGACAYPSFPNASCTGVPSGTSLTLHSGDLTVSTNGATVDAQDITGVVYVNASNVTIKRSRMRGVILSGSTTMEDDVIDCQGAQGSKGVQGSYPYGGFGDPAQDFTATRVNVSRCEDAFFAAGNFTVQDSYIHDPGTAGPDPHNDGFQLFAPINNINIIHNYVSWRDTSDIQFCSNAGCGTMSNILVKHNYFYLAPPSVAYPIYCPVTSTTNFRIIFNAFDQNSGGTDYTTECAGQTTYGNYLLPSGAPLDAGGTDTPVECATPLFPNANSSCTGVPSGTSLTAVNNGMTISTAGAIVQAKDITGQVIVNAPNVTIKDSKIHANTFTVIQNNSTNLTIQDSEIYNEPGGTYNCHNGVQDNNFTLLRVNIHSCENAVNIDGDNVVVRDSNLHDLDTVGPSWQWGMDPHTDGMQMNQGSSNIDVLHTAIDPVGSVVGVGATSAIIMYVGTGTPNSDVNITNSYLDARNSAYALYAPRVATTGININDNKMYSGSVGYTDCVRIGVTVAQFNNNRDAGTNALISADEGAGQACED